MFKGNHRWISQMDEGINALLDATLAAWRCISYY
jgi:hypothetical protein